ncbi:MAG: RNA methyltransferase [Kiritimatiellae bacterium]|nr:RNA methyltransferase [Kiritimatiellia bacterium]
MPIRITSVRNDRVRAAMALRDRRDRERTGRMLVEGYRENLRALDHGVRPLELFFCRELFLGSNEDTILARAAAAGADLLDCSEAVFRRLSYRDRPDGLIAVAPIVRRSLGDLQLGSCPLVLVMEGIEKPGNLGTMLRSADAAGADAAILVDGRTDLFNPNAIRASVGAVFTVPVAEAGGEETIAWLKARHIRIFAATPAATEPYFQCDMSGPSAIVVGSEQYGLTSAWLEAADRRVCIPMRGSCDSLNVSAAATILLHDAVRQRWAEPLDSSPRAGQRTKGDTA